MAVDFIKELESRAKANPQRVLLPEANEEKILRAAYEVKKRGIGLPILVGEPASISSLSESVGVSLDGMTMVDNTDQEKADALAGAYAKINPSLPERAVKRMLRDPMSYAAVMVALGEADCMVAGLSHTTGEVIMAAEMIIGLKEGISTVSSMGILSVPGYEGPEGNLLAIADCAVCPAPGSEELADIAISTADTAKSLLGWEPRVALLSFSTKGSAGHERVDMVIKALDIVRDRRPDLLIDGELQLDSAIDPRVAAKKNPRRKPRRGQGEHPHLPGPRIREHRGQVGPELCSCRRLWAATARICEAHIRPLPGSTGRGNCRCHHDGSRTGTEQIEFARGNVMDKKYRIFAINPGSTTTKIALFENDREMFSASVSHDAAKLKEFSEISDQLPYRREAIMSELAKRNISLEGIAAFVGRGGGLVGLTGGTYTVNEILLHHARIGFTVKHPATLGSRLADEFAVTYGGKAFVVNPPDVDEFDLIARVSGLSDVDRESRIHALNQKEVGIRYAHDIGKHYEDLNLVISHIGGGVSVTAHRKGLMVDSNDIINGDGPMAPTRAGSIPATAIIRMCYSGKYTEKEMYDRITKTGGLVDHLGTSEVKEVLARVDNKDAYAKLVYDAMIYQIGKNIGAYATALKGDVDAILLTGGVVHDTYLVERITDMVKYIAPVNIYAGEFEMEALASGALRVLTGKEEPKSYTGLPVWDGFRR